MANNQELTDLLALDLGITLINRRPHAKEIFKWLDLELLPISSVDTMLGELYEWDGRNWRTTQKNLIGYLFNDPKLVQIRNELISSKKFDALIPDFEFDKKQIIDLGFNLPSLFNIGFTGNVNNAKQLSVRVNNVTRSRITNIDPVGIEIMRAFSEFAQKKSKAYRKNIKFNYIANSLFYAENVEVILEKEASTQIDLVFDVKDVDVEVKTDTNTKKEVKLKYNGNSAPFAAKFIKGKDFKY